ncbi:MAG: Ribose-5-phosphate isomerase B [Firmicutes bacterium ADurb.Bin193]|nr:MAG: Ribose-5-phosphate isomerase B [Firmicutes bacterium ADurb.Bin193]
MRVIAIGSDHGGYELKGVLLEYLKGKKTKVIDCGTFSSDTVDYPDIAKLVGSKVVSGEAEFGILICGTGIGICMSANKIRGIRAAVLYNDYAARMAKEHNDANIICFGGRTTEPDAAKQMIEVFMKSKFKGGRHQTRVDKIMSIEE